MGKFVHHRRRQECYPATNKDLAKQALRVLMAYNIATKFQPWNSKSLSLTFYLLLVWSVIDPERPEAAEAAVSLRKRGIRPWLRWPPRYSWSHCQTSWNHRLNDTEDHCLTGLSWTLWWRIPKVFANTLFTLVYHLNTFRIVKAWQKRR